MRLLTVRAATALFALLASSSIAGAQTFTGTTVGGPTFNRPLAGDPPTVLSDFGTNVAYDVIGFRVSTSGAYNFSVASSFDSFLLLYSSSFDAASPLENAIIANDDFNGLQAGFSGVLLTTDVDYLAVTTGWSNNSQGAYSLAISGAGEALPPGTGVTPGVSVPEPASMALLLVGGMALLVPARRRRA